MHRPLLTALQSPDKIPVIMRTLISRAKSNPASLSSVPLLGISVDVALRLKYPQFQNLIDAVLKARMSLFFGVFISHAFIFFLGRDLDHLQFGVLVEVTCAKSCIGKLTSFYGRVHVLTPNGQTALRDFVQHFVDEKDLQSVILPTVEKALLRSPEIALSGDSSAGCVLIIC